MFRDSFRSHDADPQPKAGKRGKNATNDVKQGSVNNQGD